jgi:hypothetical protein
VLARLLSASERLPTWVRAASVCLLPVVAFATNVALGSPAASPMIALFLALSLFALFAHAPVFAFDGPLPFSALGVHVGGGVTPWSAVERIEPLGEKDLAAVLFDGSRLKVRVRGRRTREEFAAAIARHKPEAARF